MVCFRSSRPWHVHRNWGWTPSRSAPWPSRQSATSWTTASSVLEKKKQNEAKKKQVVVSSRKACPRTRTRLLDQDQEGPRVPRRVEQGAHHGDLPRPAENAPRARPEGAAADHRGPPRGGGDRRRPMEGRQMFMILAPNPRTCRLSAIARRRGGGRTRPLLPPHRGPKHRRAAHPARADAGARAAEPAGPW